MFLGYYYLSLLKSGDTDFPFSIHGLWPQYSDGRPGWPQYCGATFDAKALAPILPQLHANWHSSRGPDEAFWKHEWERHGSCSGMSEIDYFRTALRCFEAARRKGAHWVRAHGAAGHCVIPFELFVSREGRVCFRM